jgi:hypothetical protein
MIFVLWMTGVEPTGTLNGLPFVNILNETNQLSGNMKLNLKNARCILDTLVAWSSRSGSSTVVARNLGSSLEGKQTTTKQLLVSWVLRLDPLGDGMLTVLAVEETGFVEAQHSKDGRCTQLERSRSKSFQDKNHG